MYLASRDPRVPWYAKAAAIAVAAYALSPIDLIPDFIPVLGYLDDLASTLAASGLQPICINMRGVGESCGSLDDATLHDLAADVAGAIEVLGCGPAHLIGHAFGNRIARCLAADCPSLVRKVVVLAAGGLIAPSPPLGTAFSNASAVKLNGSDCVTTPGARWLSPGWSPPAPGVSAGAAIDGSSGFGPDSDR